MSRKGNNKKLALLFFALILIFAIAEYYHYRKGENTFKTNIIPKIDTGKINKLVIFPNKKGSKPIGFTKKGNDWMVSEEDITSRAEPNAVRNLMVEIMKISPDHLSASDPSQWKEYNVTDSLGTRVVIMVDKDTVLDLIVGRFSYNTMRKEGISNVRINGQNEVYGIEGGSEGFLSMNIAEEFDAWRDKRLLAGNRSRWTSLTFIYPADTGFSLKHDTVNGWKFGDGSKPDSAALAKGLTGMEQLNYGGFVNKYDTNGKSPLLILKIEGEEMEPVVIKAYPDTAAKYVITSTFNYGNYFNGNNNALLSKLFLSKSLLNQAL